MELIWSHFMACTGDQEAGSKHKQSLQTWSKKSQAREHTIIIISVFQIDWNWQWTLKPSEPRTSMTPTSFEPYTSSAPNQFSSGHIWIPLFIPRPNQWMLCQRTTEIWQVPNKFSGKNASNFLDVNKFSVTKRLKIQILDSLPCNFMSRLSNLCRTESREYLNIVSLHCFKNQIVNSGAHEPLSRLFTFPRTRSSNLKSSGNKNQHQFQLLIWSLRGKKTL